MTNTVPSPGSLAAPRPDKASARRRLRFTTLSAAAAAATLMAGCTTSFSQTSLSELARERFAEDPEVVTSRPDWYVDRVEEVREDKSRGPDLSDVPDVPDDVRSARQWNRAVDALNAQRAAVLNDPAVSEPAPRTSTEEFLADARARVAEGAGDD